MMAYELCLSTLDDFDKFIHKFQRETKTLIRKLERILKNYIDKMSLLFNQIYIFEQNSSCMATWLSSHKPYKTCWTLK